jgi:hypothetical protein
MKSITELIDKRIDKLNQLRKEEIVRNDRFFSQSTWARLDELQGIKRLLTDKDGNWLI